MANNKGKNIRTFGIFRKVFVMIFGEKFSVKSDDVELTGYSLNGKHYIVKERYHNEIVTSN
jgi:hypothetical protein